jgi:CRP-like cAMP-binding protein
MDRISEFFSNFTLVTYQKGERIIREHEDPSHVFLVKRGIARMYLISLKGNELTTLLLSSGDLFPIRWINRDLRNIYNFQAMTEIEVWRAPKDKFRAFMYANQDVMQYIMQSLLQDRRILVYRLQCAIFGSATNKVASSLLIASQRYQEEMSEDESAPPEVPLTHQQIADLSGITRETTSVELKKMEAEGLISYRGRTIVLNNFEGLQKVASEL